MSGVRRLSDFKRYCREYENYMAAFYDYEIVKSPGAVMNSYCLQKNLYARVKGNPHRYVKVKLMP